MLNQVIVLVDYFTANHADNQSIMQSGSQPSVLQQLASLLFQYFSQTELKAILFPTLLSSCYNCAENSAILSQEMSWQLIDEFVESDEGMWNFLVQLVKGARGHSGDNDNLVKHFYYLSPLVTTVYHYS